MRCTVSSCSIPARMILLLAAALAAAACEYTDRSHVSIGFRSVPANAVTLAPAGPAAATAPVDRYVFMRAQKKAQGGFAFALLPRDLWGPFRWELTAGLFDPAHANVGPGFFCTELDARGTNPLQFYALCVQPVPGGLLVFVSSHLGNHGQLFLAGATIVDLAVEHDGTNLLFQVREAGTPDYALVAQVPLDPQPFPLLPSIGVSNVGQGAEAGFDNFRVPFNGVSPVALTPEQAVVRLIWDDAVDDEVAALFLLDGPTPDAAAARANLVEAQGGLDGILVAAQALTPTKAVKKAIGKLQAAQGKVKAAIAAIDAGKPETKSINKIGKAIDAEVDAAGLFEPFSLGSN